MASRVEIGKKVRIERRDLGYTQQKLSELIRINKTTISEIENGRFTGSFDIFERVLDAVGLQLMYLQSNIPCPIGMRLKICLLRRMNEFSNQSSFKNHQYHGACQSN